MVVRLVNSSVGQNSPELAVKVSETSGADSVSLHDMIRQDPDLREFFKFIHKEDLRAEALIALDEILRNPVSR